MEKKCGEGAQRGRPVFVACSSASHFAARVAERYGELSGRAVGGGVAYLEKVDFSFADSETCARLAEDVSGCDVFLFQALCDPASGRTVDQNYMAFLIAARTCRVWGAEHVTAVLPYLAYARQDKPTWFEREPTTAGLMADLSVEAGIDRLVTWHPHCGQIRGFYGGIPVNVLDALGFFAEEFSRFRGRDDVIAVAPDAGASKFVGYFGRALGLKCAIASKDRPEPGKTVVREIIGDFSGKTTAIVIDDMIGSGGTVHELITKLSGEKGIEEVYLGASHNLCMDVARQRLLDLHERHNLRQVVVTESIPQTAGFTAMPFLAVRPLSDIMATVIRRIHFNEHVGDGR